MPQNVLYDRGNRGNTIAKILKGLGAPYMREIKEAEGSIYVCWRWLITFAKKYHDKICCPQFIPFKWTKRNSCICERETKQTIWALSAPRYTISHFTRVKNQPHSIHSTQPLQKDPCTWLLLYLSPHEHKTKKDLETCDIKLEIKNTYLGC